MVDEVGRTVETRTVIAGQTLQVGDKYRKGIYFVQAIQGTPKVTVRLLKQ